MKNQGTVTEGIISSICKLTKSNLSDIRRELQNLEPAFDKWARISVKDDIQKIKYGGVTIHSEDAARAMGSIIIQAKIEGYLIAQMAQDREWCDKLFLDHNDDHEDIPYLNAVTALMDGKLSKDVYDKLERKMTDEEKDNPNHWKNRAINKFKDMTNIKEVSKSVRNYMNNERKKDGDKGDDRSDVPPDVEITP